MLPLQVIHQLILPHETIHALARAVTEGAIEIFGSGLVALHVTIEVSLTDKGFDAADVGAGEATVGDGRRCDGSCGHGLRSGSYWCVGMVGVSGERAFRSRETGVLGSDILSVSRGDLVGVTVSVERIGIRLVESVVKPIWIEMWVDGKMGLDVKIEALLVGTTDVAAGVQAHDAR